MELWLSNCSTNPLSTPHRTRVQIGALTFDEVSAVLPPTDSPDRLATVTEWLLNQHGISLLTAPTLTGRTSPSTGAGSCLSP